MGLTRAKTESRWGIEFACDKVTIHREGDRLVIQPIRRKDLLEVLAGMDALEPEDQFPDIDDTFLPLRDVQL